MGQSLYWARSLGKCWVQGDGTEEGCGGGGGVNKGEGMRL